MKPKTPQQVLDCFFREGWDAACVFYDCSRDCRDIGADLIRRSLPLLREHTGFGKELRTLVGAVDENQRDDVVEEGWKSAIDALRALQRTSPFDTQRGRVRLLGIARNSILVEAMLHAAESEDHVDPSWLAVFSAEGSPNALGIVERCLATYGPQHRKLASAILSFKNALSSRRSPVPIEPSESTSLPIDLHAKRITKDRFWAIIEHASAATDPGSALKQCLSKLRASQVAAFAAHFDAAMNRAHTYSLWGAAYLLLGGCSDDGFQDFRASLILRGKRVFDQILEDPDALADFPDIEGDESLLALADQVYEEQSGSALPRKASPVKNPQGAPFDFDDDHLMSMRYPRVHALRER